MSNINHLIEEKNIKRDEMRVNPIKVDAKLDTHLLKQNKSKTYIPTQGEKVVLRPNCNFSEGGETHRIDINFI